MTHREEFPLVTYSVGLTVPMTYIKRTLTALLAAMALALGAFASAAPANAADDVTLVVTELPAQVRLIPGEAIELTLETNRTTGYTWKATKSGKKKAVKVSKGSYTPPNTTMVGAPGLTTWTITAIKPGTVDVNIAATPPGGGDAEVSTLKVIVMKDQS